MKRMRDLRVHHLYIVGLSGCAEDHNAPSKPQAARKNLEGYDCCFIMIF